MYIAMLRDEIELLTRHLAPGITYLEFGAGGSTHLAIRQGVARCHSVETAPSWIQHMREDASIRLAEDSGVLTFHPCDIGPVREWGLPVDKGALEKWPAFFLGVWSQLETDPEVILVDGRFRTATGLTALLVCPPETTLLVHDFYDQMPFRKNYHRLLAFADELERATNLVSLKIKPKACCRALVSTLADVWNDYW